MFDNIKAFAFDIDGVFTDGLVLATADGDLLRSFNSKDCFAVRTAITNGYKVAIITGGCSQSLVHRAHSFGVVDEDIYQLSKNKRPDLEHFCSKYGLSLEDVAFVGDDIPDIPALKVAGLSVCPADAVQEVKEVCNYVSPFNGGRGCIRDLVERVLKIQGRWSFDPEDPWPAHYPDSILKAAEKTGKNV